MYIQTTDAAADYYSGVVVKGKEKIESAALNATFDSSHKECVRAVFKYTKELIVGDWEYGKYKIVYKDYTFKLTSQNTNIKSLELVYLGSKKLAKYNSKARKMEIGTIVEVRDDLIVIVWSNGDQWVKNSFNEDAEIINVEMKDNAESKWGCGVNWDSMIIKRVDPGKQASSKGITVGSKITKWNNRDINESTEWLTQVQKNLDNGTQGKITLVRNKDKIHNHYQEGTFLKIIGEEEFKTNSDPFRALNIGTVLEIKRVDLTDGWLSVNCKTKTKWPQNEWIAPYNFTNIELVIPPRKNARFNNEDAISNAGSTTPSSYSTSETPDKQKETEKAEPKIILDKKGAFITKELWEEIKTTVQKSSKKKINISWNVYDEWPFVDGSILESEQEMLEFQREVTANLAKNIEFLLNTPNAEGKVNKKKTSESEYEYLVERKLSPNRGMGLFATKNLSQGSILGLFNGILYRKRAANPNYKTIASSRQDYLLNIGFLDNYSNNNINAVIDPFTLSGSINDFRNDISQEEPKVSEHNKKQNMIWVPFEYDSMQYVAEVIVQEVLMGEEILTWYGKEYIKTTTSSKKY
jgi:hypothetical protein